MKIGIDARMLGEEQTGIGLYIKNLIENIAKLDQSMHEKSVSCCEGLISAANNSSLVKVYPIHLRALHYFRSKLGLLTTEETSHTCSRNQYILFLWS